MRSATAGGITLIDLEPTAADFRAEFVAGLRQRPRKLPCKFFYDERGAALFDDICELPEYYLTRTELEILGNNLEAIRHFCGASCVLVEPGSGSSQKTRLLLDALEEPATYVPIDISRAHLQRTALALQHEYPGLKIVPFCADYAQAIQLPAPAVEGSRNVIFFPGSTIGNFEPDDATAFLQHMASWCEPGDRLLIGVDLEKDRQVVLPAYNDARGITAAFNLNLLARANRELGANFILEHFSHEAVYDVTQGRIEMHLVSARRQTVVIGHERAVFEAGERIVTEHSYKYEPAHFIEVADAADWSAIQQWSDAREWFGVFAFELREKYAGVIQADFRPV
jgi:dimethylhistidine N-methyltransferase